MKVLSRNLRRWLLAAAAAMVLAPASAQTVLLDEGFEGTGLPAGWTATPGVVTGTAWNGWKLGTAATLSSNYFTPPATNSFIAVNDDAAGNSVINQNVTLTSPEIDLSTVTAAFGLVDVYFKKSSYQSGEENAFIKIFDVNGTDTTTLELEGDDAWQSLSIDLAAFIGDTIQAVIIYTDNGGWVDGLAIDNVRVLQPADRDVALLSLNIQSLEYVAAGAKMVSGVIRNLGAAPLTSLDVELSVQAGTPLVMNLTGLNVAPFASAPFSHTSQASLPTPGVYDITVNTANPNGGADANPADNTLSHSLTALSVVPAKKLVVEEITSNTCVYCPGGHYWMNRYTNEVAGTIPVVWHGELQGAGSSDLDNDDSQAFLGEVDFPGYPSHIAGRIFQKPTTGFFVDVYYWQDLKDAMIDGLERVAPASIEILDHAYDHDTRELTVNVKSKFFGPVDGDLRMAVWVVEDSVSGEGSTYDQRNAYDDATSGGQPLYPDFYGKGDPIEGYQHRHVLRQAVGGVWGQAGLIPSSVNDGDEFTHTFTTTLPTTYNLDRINLVAVVQRFTTDYNYREVFNAAEEKLDTAIVDRADAFEGEFSVWPNPTDGTLNVSFPGADAHMTLLDVTGRELMTRELSGNAPGRVHTTDLSGFPAGVYVVRLVRGNERTAVRIVVR